MEQGNKFERKDIVTKVVLQRRRETLDIWLSGTLAVCEPLFERGRSASCHSPLQTASRNLRQSSQKEYPSCRRLFVQIKVVLAKQCSPPTLIFSRPLANTRARTRSDLLLTRTSNRECNLLNSRVKALTLACEERSKGRTVSLPLIPVSASILSMATWPLLSVLQAVFFCFFL